MQDPWSIVITVLLAVLVGASLPVLFMIFSTLGSTRQLILRLGPRMDAVLKEVQETTVRMNSATVGIDESAQRAKKLLDATGDLGESVQKLNQSLKPAVALGSVVGPAVAVAIKAFLDRQAQACGPDAADDQRQTAETESKKESPTSRGDEG
jgi:uncharacterized protein YoxC